MLEKGTSPHPIPAPPSRIPRPLALGGGAHLGSVQSLPQQRMPRSFPPTYPSLLPLASGCAPVPPSVGLPLSSPEAPTPTPGTRTARGPLYRAVQLTVLGRPAAAPALPPLLLEANLPRVLQGDSLACLLLPHLPPSRQAGPEGSLCGWGSGDTRRLRDLTCA